MSDILDRFLAERTGAPRPCSHWACHTVYGADDPQRNGTWCQLCGKKLR